MDLSGATALVTGRGSALEPLARALRGAGAGVLLEPDEAFPARFFFHVWTPLPEPAGREAYAEAVTRPAGLAARLAGSLEHLCLVRPGGADEPARALEDAFAFLARHHALPFAVLHAEGPAPVGAAAVFAAAARVSGRLWLDRAWNPSS